jgi:RNase H-like domain found in reverse transcriptase/Reverse transcriptase (RNA-dependent DNA polymerase)/Integrase zinc binding domain/Retroviral aspartyl protease
MPVAPSDVIEMIDDLCFLRDCDALYPLQGSKAFPVHECICNNEAGKSLFDTGAIYKNYISKKYFDKLGILLKTTTPRAARLPNGQTMAVYGTATLPLHLSEWTGPMEVDVIDMDADFDVILGLPWHRQNRLDIRWETMVYEVKQDGKTRRIFPVQGSNKMIDVGDASLNIITERQAKKVLLKKGAEFAVYYHHSVERNDPVVDPTDTLASMEEPSPEDKKLNELLKEYNHIFRASLPDELPPGRAIEHEIETGDAAPINTQAYPLSSQQLKEQMKQIAELLEKGLIRESTSSWGSPVLFVKKANGGWRMCVDYRGLNIKMHKNTYPLPLIQECIDQMGGATHMSTLDLTSGYWQIRVALKDIAKTAFNTRYGKYEFLVMPFGLTNAPATFQTLINNVLRPFLDKFVVVYLDDITVYSNSYEEHLGHLRQVFEALARAKLYANPAKCVFNKVEVKFCGHIIGNSRVQVLEDKIKAINDWPQPQTIQHIHQFLGLAGYYRRFIKNFSQLATPLSNPLRVGENAAKHKNRFISWNTTCQLAFDRLKAALTNAPVLQQVDPQKPFVVETDASDFAIGSCLLQKADDRQLHPVAFESRKLSDAQTRYPVHEKELLAIKQALLNWQRCLDNGHRITVVTDHESLKYMNTIKKPSARLTRWIDEFQMYDLDIKYRPGVKATVPDALSRRPDYLTAIQEREKQNCIEYVEHMEMYLTDRTLPGDEFDELVKTEAKNFVLNDGRLYRKIREGVVAPYLEWLFRGDFIQKMHNEYGHLSYRGMTNLIETRAWWPSMAQDIQAYVQSCPNCQIAQRQRPNQEREYARLPTNQNIEPFQRWGIDLIGILPQTPSGNKWILTAVDYATGWPLAKALPAATEDAIADFIFHDIYMHYGAPQEIFTDGGKNLWGGAVQKYLAKIKTIHKGTSPYHPHTNGKVESLNGLIGGILTKLLLGKSTKLWDLYLEQALFACRVRTHATTKTSPFYLVYGKHPRLLGDTNAPMADDTPISDPEMRIRTVSTARQEAAWAMYEWAVQSKALRDELVQEHELSEGEWVLVWHENPQKFESKWFGPYQINERMALGTYRLQDPNGKELQALVNGNRIVKAFCNSYETLAKLWVSPAGKDALRRINKRVEFVRPDEDGTQRLERLLLGDPFKQVVEQVPIEGDEKTRQQGPHLKEPVAEASDPTLAKRTVEDQDNHPRKQRKGSTVSAPT